MIDLAGKKILLVSMHNKEEAIQPVFAQHFNADIVVAKGVNTDQFGMFSGEIKRKKSAKETVLEKCLYGLKKYPSFDYAIASEGSFGSHPDSAFLPYNEEWLIFVDRLKNETIYAKSGTSNTNFIKQKIESESELKSFISKFEDSKFILKSVDEKQILVKGSSDLEDLTTTAQIAFKNKEPVFIETDLRAMNNPLRMDNIAKAAELLVEAIKSDCPQCNKPGFVIQKSIPGLPCELCGLPSDYPKNHVKVCGNCNYELIVEPIHNQKYLDPQYCQHCNP